MQLNDPLIYLASPYSHKHQNIREYRHHKVGACTAWLMEQGYFIFSPILHNHTLVNHLTSTNTLGFEYWKAYDLAMLDKCDKMFVCCLPSWEDSVGVTAEIKHAEEKLKIPIKYVLLVNGIWSIT